MATETPQQELARLRAENQVLKATAAAGPKLTIKVGLSGTACVYGLGRYPVALYKSQWKRLLAIAPAIEKFLVENDSVLKDKADKPA